MIGVSIYLRVHPFNYLSKVSVFFITIFLELGSLVISIFNSMIAHLQNLFS